VLICPAPPSGACENGPRPLVPPDCVPVTPPANIPADGGPKFGWFKMLKNSTRNCTRPASPRNPNFVSFINEKSQFLKGGPGRKFRPEVPSWPTVFGVQGLFGSGAMKKQEVWLASELSVTGVFENMAGLYHWLILPVRTVFGSYGMGV